VYELGDRESLGLSLLKNGTPGLIPVARRLDNAFQQINRGYYTVARRYGFYVRVAITISYE